MTTELYRNSVAGASEKRRAGAQRVPDTIADFRAKVADRLRRSWYATSLAAGNLVAVARRLPDGAFHLRVLRAPSEEAYFGLAGPFTGQTNETAARAVFALAAHHGWLVHDGMFKRLSKIGGAA